MAYRMSYGIWISCAVNAYSFFVERDPEIRRLDFEAQAVT